MDQFVTYEIDRIKKQGIPPGMVFMGRNPYRDPSLSDFREKAAQSRYILARYFLDYFYDCSSNTVKGAKDFFYLLPPDEKVSKFLMEYDSIYNQDGTGSYDYTTEGDKIFKRLYKQIEDTLVQY